MSECLVFCDDLVIGKTEKGQIRLGVVQQVGGVEDSDNSTDSDEDAFTPAPLEQGLIRVSWYNSCAHKSEEVVPESELEVIDRSCFPRDVVRTKDGNQLGTVIATYVNCDLVVIGTSKFLEDIDVSKLVRIEAFEHDDIIALGPWLGRVQETCENLILKFSNGARAKIDYDTAEDQDLLSEVYPHNLNQDDLSSSVFFPGQLLEGPSKAFKDIKWISGDEIKFRPKRQYRVVVEQIELHGVKVKWGSKAFPDDDILSGSSPRQTLEKENETPIQDRKTWLWQFFRDLVFSAKVDDEDGSSVDPKPPERKENRAEPPPSIIDGKTLEKLRRLDHIWQGHVWVGDRFRFQVSKKEADDLNAQIHKSSKMTKKKKTGKRMKKKLQQSTSQGSLDAAKVREQNANSGSTTSMKDELAEDAVEDSDNEAEYDGDDDDAWSDEEENDDDDDSKSLQPSAGSCASIPEEEEESEVDVLVNNESDLNITSPIGQIPTMLGIMSCRSGGLELDFTLVQGSGPSPKRRFQCNIQNPECPKEATEKIGKHFQDFMKSMLKKNKHLVSTTSCAAIMSQCPQAVRTFISRQSSLDQQEIFFEYTADGKHTSGMIDKDGKKTEVEYEDKDWNFLSIPQAVQVVSEAISGVLGSKDDVVLTTAPPGRKQGGNHIKFQEGQWITVEVAKTESEVDVQWQDGTIEKNVETPSLLPAHHVDDNDFCPGDFVTDKRVPEDSNYYGVVLKVDGENRMAKIQWIRNEKPEEIEEVSSYEIADHEELQFRISDIILKTGSKYGTSEDETNISDDQAVGELLRITEKGMLSVLWSNGTIGLVHPRSVMNVPNDDGASMLASSDSDEEATSWTTASSDEGQSNLDSDSEDVGDGDQARPKENGVDSPEANHGMGEGADTSELPNHESETLVSEEDINQEILSCVQDITNSVCGSLNTQSDNKGEFNADGHATNSSSRINTGKNKGEVQVDTLDVNDNAANASTSEFHEKGSKVMQGDEDHQSKVEDDVIATISAESIASDESATSHSDDRRSFLMEASVPSSHHFANRYFEASKPFVKALQRDLKLLRASLPPGITVKAFEDRMDLLSVLIEGPHRTPYEDGLFCFDICLSRNYPDSPPSVHYVSFSPRLNPNLYETGRVCVSLLGTWSGKGSEKWTKDSNVLQVLLSIQGLILNSEPYYNEAGYEGHRGTAEGIKNSRCYNEMVTLRLVQHMTSLIQNPPKTFHDEVNQFCTEHVPLLLSRVRDLLTQSDAVENSAKSSLTDNAEGMDVGFPLLPLSKGVTLSLKTRLLGLASAARVTGFL